MSLLVIHHPDCAGHDPSPGHPEAPARIEAAMAGLRDLPGCTIRQAREVSEREILRIHPTDYWQRIQASEPDAGQPSVALDPDTRIGAGSLRAIRLSAGAACQGVEALLGGQARRVLCITRPPGHHAEANRSMGFCVLNNVALAAAGALEDPAIERVAIVDFDVHHGNGTQAIFEHDPRVIFVSSHQSPLYPGTGAADEHGVGNIFNAELAPGSGSAAFRAAWEQNLLVRLDEARPDLVLVSAGFDAHRLDPLAQLELETEDYAWIGRRLAELASRHAGGRLLAVLEGGYSLQALAESCKAFAAAVDGEGC